VNYRDVPPGASTLILSGSDVAEIVRAVGCHEFMDRLIANLHTAFAAFDVSTTHVPVRDGFHYETPVTGLVEWMPLYQQGESVLMKMVGYHPQNPSNHGIPTVLSTLSLFDTRTGAPSIIADGALLTSMRTGAASAVATRILAREKSRVVGLIGCGAQAVTQLHALTRVREIDTVRYFDINKHVMATFAERLKPLVASSVQFVPSSLESVVSQSDILCTATSIGVGEGPLFHGIDSASSLHVNAVGSDLSGKTELPLNLLEASCVCPDFPEQARLEGECQQLETDSIGPSLLDLMHQVNDWPARKNQRTVFDSTGWALEDAVALRLLMQHALAKDIGLIIDLSGTTQDPWNPYEAITAIQSSDQDEQSSRDQLEAGTRNLHSSVKA